MQVGHGHIHYNFKNQLQEKSERNKIDTKDKINVNKNMINKEVKSKDTQTIKTINCVQDDFSSEDLVKTTQIFATINGI